MHIQVTLRTVAYNEPIYDIGGVLTCWEGSHVTTLSELKKKNSKYAVLDPEGPAEVSIGLEEKVSGPEGTYSSVTVFVRVTLRCAQTENQVRAAQNLAHSECITTLEKYIEPAQRLLISHLRGRNG